MSNRQKKVVIGQGVAAPTLASAMKRHSKVLFDTNVGLPRWNVSTKFDSKSIRYYNTTTTATITNPLKKVVIGQGVAAPTLASVMKRRSKVLFDNNVGLPRWNVSTKFDANASFKEHQKMINNWKKMKSKKMAEKVNATLFMQLNEKKIEAMKTSAIIYQEFIEEEKKALENQIQLEDKPIDFPSFNSRELPVPMENSHKFIKKYGVGFTIGNGAHSMVYKGHFRDDNGRYDITKQPDCVIKRQSKSGTYGYSIVDNEQYLPLEYCILNKLSNCKGVIRLLDAYDIGDDYIYVMQFCGETTLEQYIKTFWSSRPMDEAFTKRVFRNLVKAVRQCHVEAGVCHRDLKEANIIINIYNDDEPLLIDFGMSQLTEKSPYFDKCGTPGYFAPEMVDIPNGYDGQQAEIYALGVVLYDMIFGCIGWEPLFTGQTPKVSTDCLKLLNAMLASRAEDRPTLDQILNSTWMRLSKQEEIQIQKENQL
jgi:tRNA A-37 threonylcarbamoyl transferase component Bud32